MDIVVRAVLAFAFVFFLTRGVGQRELSSLQPFDVIMLVMLGDLVQQGVTQNDFSVTGLVPLTHHERWDGTGYISRLSGEDIPISGRIVAVADVFDALTHRRPYKAAWPVEQAVAEIARLSGRQFDPRIVEAFAELDHERLLLLPHAERHLAVVA